MTSRTEPFNNYPRKSVSHSKERNSQTKDVKVQLAKNGPPCGQHHDKDWGASAIPKICQSANSLTTVEARPHEKRPYPGCGTHAIEGGKLMRRKLGTYELSPPIGRELATCELSPLAGRELATCELSPLVGRELVTW